MKDNSDSTVVAENEDMFFFKFSLHYLLLFYLLQCFTHVMRSFFRESLRVKTIKGSDAFTYFYFHLCRPSKTIYILRSKQMNSANDCVVYNICSVCHSPRSKPQTALPSWQVKYFYNWLHYFFRLINDLLSAWLFTWLPVLLDIFKTKSIFPFQLSVVTHTKTIYTINSLISSTLLGLFLIRFVWDVQRVDDDLQLCNK